MSTEVGTETGKSMKHGRKWTALVVAAVACLAVTGLALYVLPASLSVSGATITSNAPSGQFQLVKAGYPFDNPVCGALNKDSVEIVVNNTGPTVALQNACLDGTFCGNGGFVTVGGLPLNGTEPLQWPAGTQLTVTIRTTGYVTPSNHKITFDFASGLYWSVVVPIRST